MYRQTSETIRIFFLTCNHSVLGFFDFESSESRFQDGYSTFAAVVAVVVAVVVTLFNDLTFH